MTFGVRFQSYWIHIILKRRKKGFWLAYALPSSCSLTMACSSINKGGGGSPKFNTEGSNLTSWHLLISCPKPGMKGIKVLVTNFSHNIRVKRKYLTYNLLLTLNESFKPSMQIMKNILNSNESKRTTNTK